MKKLILLFFLFYQTLCNAQGTTDGSISISGNTSVEVGITYPYTLTFTPPATLPTGATAFEIERWQLSTSYNGLTQNGITGFVGESWNNISSSYDINGSNLALTQTLPIQCGDGVISTWGQVRAAVDVRYFNATTGQNVLETFLSPWQTFDVTVHAIQTPFISGVNNVPDCSQPNTTHTISNDTNGNQFLWAVTNGTIVGANNGMSVVVTPALTGSYTVSCSVRRSTANPNYVKTGSKTITRSAPTTTASITGSSSLCSGAKTYTISNLPAGHSVSSWSISNSSIASLSSTTGNSVTLTKVGNGQLTLTANISNNCSQIIPKTKTIYVGSPIIPSAATIIGPTSVGTNQTYNYSLSMPATNGATSYTWSIDAPSDDVPPLCNWQVMSGQGTTAASIKTGCEPGLAVVRIVATSSCGTSNMKYTYVTVDDPCPTMMSLSQNPVKGSSFTVSLTEPYPCDPTAGAQKSERRGVYDCTIRIFDINGRQVYNGQKSSNELTFDGLILEKGMYILQLITDGGAVMTEKLIFE